MFYNVVVCFTVFEFFSCFVFCSTIPPPTTETSLAFATTENIQTNSEKTLYEKGLQDYDEAVASERQARGMMDDEIDYHDHHNHDYHDHHHPEPMKEEQKAAVEDPWEGYYDFIINEGSFKFWAAFQLVTAALLIYSAFAAVYYAKFNVITTDYDYYDDFYGRGRANTDSSYSSLWSGLSSQTFQRIMDAISSKKYT